eukprot:7177243-Lingulodinium_polyedra.AAC.1
MEIFTVQFGFLKICSLKNLMRDFARKRRSDEFAPQRPAGQPAVALQLLADKPGPWPPEH